MEEQQPARPEWFDRAQDKTAGILLYLGGVGQLSWQTIRLAFTTTTEWRTLLVQFDAIAVESLSIVGIASLFIGMVLALQTAYTLAQFGGAVFVGRVVSLSLIRELSPVLMSLMVGGRVGAGMTAEIGTMKVTEQIDALRAMATSPVRKLVVPKVIATTFALPILTIVANLIGVLGGMIVAVTEIHVTAAFYLRSAVAPLLYDDLFSGVGKTFFFGFTLAIIACFNGLRTTGGADGVGRATTATVVTTSITIMIMDFFLTKAFLLF